MSDTKQHITTERRTYRKVLEADYDNSTYNALYEPTPDQPANVVSSLLVNGKHAPALDIDIPVRVVESSTPGHCHLYFDTVELPWDVYAKLLVALGEAGILEPGYVSASLDRGQTLLRLPGVSK